MVPSIAFGYTVEEHQTMLIVKPLAYEIQVDICTPIYYSIMLLLLNQFIGI